MRQIYDPDADVLSVRLRSTAIAESAVLEDGIEVLLDGNGHVNGFNYQTPATPHAQDEQTFVTWEALSTKRREASKFTVSRSASSCMIRLDR